MPLLNFSGGEQMGEKDFEREVLDRLAIIETKLDPVLSNCRECNKIIGQHSVSIAELCADINSAHHRIDGVYNTAGIISTVIGVIVNLLAFAIQHARSGTH